MTEEQQHAQIDILTNSKDVRLSTGKPVKVRGLCWSDALKLLRRAGDGMGKLMAVKEDGAVTVDLGRAQELIVESEELIGVVLDGAVDLAAEEIGRLPVEDVLAILDGALELTLTPGLTKNVQALGERMRGLLSPDKRRKPSITSSPRDMGQNPSPGTPSGN